jgi:hypothetical protein
MIHNPYASTTKNTIKPRRADTSSSSAHEGPSPAPALAALNKPTARISEASNSKENGSEIKYNKSGSSDSMYWQRLPSQNLSFGSSEILTVDECITHATLYQGRSIKTTGLLQQRFCDGEAETVVLELVHPISKTQGRYSTTKTPPKRPLQVQPKSIQKPGFLRKRKRPWFAGTPKLKSATAVPGKMKSATAVPGKIKSATAVPAKRLKAVVDLKMPGLDELLVGSTIVMVIGTILQNGTIQARIVQKMNHFDMTFYTNSLNARRKLIYQKYQQHTTQSANQQSQQTDQSAPIHGCGPPPYTKFLTNG